MSTGSRFIHCLGTKEHLDQAFNGTPVFNAGLVGIVRHDYHVNIPRFEGPLDLLIHLIRKDQIDIYDIPIAQICQSYLEYIGRLSCPDFNLAGEFMVMAATLMFLKSAMLLPREEDESAEDPRLPLVAKLLEYEKFQKAAKYLDTLPWLEREIFPRPASSCKDLLPTEALLNAAVEPVETYQLLVALKIATDRTLRPSFKVDIDSVSLKQKVEEMGQKFETTDIAELAMFVPLHQPAKIEIIVAFLAILELARLGFVEIIQYENFGPIQVRKIRSFGELNVSLLDQF